MPLEFDSARLSVPALGSLQSCLVEGDPEQRRRERRVRRKALFTSVIVQASVLATVILIPLFAKPAPLSTNIVTPVPPYRRATEPPHHETSPNTQIRHICTVCWNSPPQPIITGQRIPPSDPQTGIDEIDIIPQGVPCPTCVPGGTEPSRPTIPIEPHRQKGPVLVTHLDPAMLIHRVEPVYPILPRQTHRSGRVELRATIATDGSIQSLRVVSGDPLFYESAMNAVSQWRYRPTVLNGEPVEIDTFITVIYNIDH